MKPYFIVALALCLLLSGCGPQPAAPTEQSAATVPTETYTPYHMDAAARGLQVDVTYRSDAYPLLGRLNNRYGGQAQALYDTLGVSQLKLSQLPVPNGAWVRMAFSTVGGTGEETFTLYDNNLVVTHHPVKGERRCTAAPGTYERVLAYLEQVQTDQSRFVTYEAEGLGEDGYHTAGYVLYDKKGKVAHRVSTDTRLPTVELVGEGLVRVTVEDTTRLYDAATGRSITLPTTMVDVAGDRMAVAQGHEITVRRLFGTTPLCRLYVATTEDNPQPVQSLALSPEGDTLHVVVHNAAGTLYDRTVTVDREVEGSTLRILGDWREALTPATEKEGQTTAYTILKKLRHKEKELGFLFSGTLLGHLQVGKTEYLLCELGHWSADTQGGTTQYETVGYLMVPASLSAGYEAVLEDNEIAWDTAKNWFKK